MAKRRKSKGKRRGGKKSKKGRISHQLSKPGAAETLGILWTVFNTETSPGLIGAQKAGFKSVDGFKYAVKATADVVKREATPAVVGLVISNIDAIPVIGKMLSPVKRRADRLSRKFLGMKL
jgi:hypothetical protein